MKENNELGGNEFGGNELQELQLLFIKSYNSDSKVTKDNFDELLGEALYEALDSPEYTIKKFKEVELVHSDDDWNYDSYGNEDTDIEHVFKYKDKFFMLTGRRQSHSGTEVEGLREVQQKIKTVQYYG